MRFSILALPSTVFRSRFSNFYQESPDLKRVSVARLPACKIFSLVRFDDSMRVRRWSLLRHAAHARRIGCPVSQYIPSTKQPYVSSR